MARIDLPSGFGITTFITPQRTRIFSPRSDSPAVEPEILVRQALKAPIASPPLGRLIRDCKKVAVLVDDITRITPTHLMLPPLLAELEEAGIRRDNIYLILALGTHRPMTAGEIAHKLGPETAADYRVINTSSRDDRQMVSLGRMSDGSPAMVLREVAEADLRVGLGMISPHMDVGYSGGAKIILPGVCGEETIRAFHSRQAWIQGNQLGAPVSSMRRYLEDFIRQYVGLEFILNAVIDGAGMLRHCVAGNAVKAQRAGAELARRVFGLHVGHQYPIVISNAYPNEQDLWQSTKALAAGDLMTSDGGSLILVTACPEGSRSHPLFGEYIGRSSKELQRELSSGEARDPIACGVALPLTRIRERVRVCLVSEGLDREEADVMGFTYYGDINEALETEIERQGPHSEVAVLTQGGVSLPILDE